MKPDPDVDHGVLLNVFFLKLLRHAEMFHITTQCDIYYVVVVVFLPRSCYAGLSMFYTEVSASVRRKLELRIPALVQFAVQI